MTHFILVCGFGTEFHSELDSNYVGLGNLCLKGTFLVLIAYFKSKTDNCEFKSPKFLRPVEMANYSGLISFLLAKRRDV